MSLAMTCILIGKWGASRSQAVFACIICGSLLLGGCENAVLDGDFDEVLNFSAASLCEGYEKAFEYAAMIHVAPKSVAEKKSRAKEYVSRSLEAIASQKDKSIKISSSPTCAEWTTLAADLELSERDMVEIAMSLSMESLDPHSSFTPKDRVESLRWRINGKRTNTFGIEVYLSPAQQRLLDLAEVSLSKDEGLDALVDQPQDSLSRIQGGFLIAEIDHLSPADKAGMKEGMRIVAVDEFELDTATNEQEDVVQSHLMALLRIKNAKSIRLLVETEGEGEDLYELTKGEAYPQSIVRTQSLDEGQVFYFRLAHFHRQTNGSQKKSVSESVEEVLAGAMEEGAESIIVDLRSNGGGYLDQAIAIADLFIGDGKVLCLHASEQKNHAMIERGIESRCHSVGRRQVVPESMPVVILVDSSTASAAEILAQILFDNGKTVIGTPSFGKGTVQRSIPLGPKTKIEGIITTTVQTYSTATGHIVQLAGVSRDVQFKSDLADEIEEQVRSYEPRMIYYEKDFSALGQVLNLSDWLIVPPAENKVSHAITKEKVLDVSSWEASACDNDREDCMVRWAKELILAN